MSLRVDKDVLWLQVSIEDALMVEIFHSEHDLCQVKPTHIFCEAPIAAGLINPLSRVNLLLLPFLELKEELSPRTVLEHDKQVVSLWDS